MGYYWTQRARTMAAALGIAPANVIDVLYSASKLVMTGTDDGKPVLLFWGRTDAGRPVIVTLRPDEDEDGGDRNRRLPDSQCLRHADLRTGHLHRMGEQPMSTEGRIAAITFDPASTLPAANFPGPAEIPAEGVMVKRSVKWSTITDDAIKATAERKGVTASELIRQYIEMGLASENPGLVVDLADIWRILSTVAHPPAA